VHSHAIQDDKAGESESINSHDSDEEREIYKVHDGDAKDDGNVVYAEADDCILCPDNFEIDVSAVNASEEVPLANFIAVVQKCQSGLHLFNEIQTLPNSGRKLKVSLTVNRGIKALATLKKIDTEDGYVTWGKCKKNLREKLVNAFRAVVPVTQDWLSLTTAIIEPFLPK
jgi:hypothetical protein